MHERENDYQKCREELTAMADKINAEFAPSPKPPVVVLEVTNDCFLAFGCYCHELVVVDGGGGRSRFCYNEAARFREDSFFRNYLKYRVEKAVPRRPYRISY